jgi:hypothetical protein
MSKAAPYNEARDRMGLVEESRALVAASLDPDTPPSMVGDLALGMAERCWRLRRASGGRSTSGLGFHVSFWRHAVLGDRLLTLAGRLYLWWTLGVMRRSPDDILPRVGGKDGRK